MPPVRRSTRRRQLRVPSLSIESERCSTREKKRHEILTPDQTRSLPSARIMHALRCGAMNAISCLIPRQQQNRTFIEREACRTMIMLHSRLHEIYAAKQERRTD